MAKVVRSPRRRAGSLRGLLCSVAVVLVCRGLTVARAQSEDETCTDVVVVGLSEEDGFSSETTVYTNIMTDDDVRGEYVSEDETHFIWYSPTDPTEYTADTPDADVGDCRGLWVISLYPVGDTFTDTVWYESTGGAQCDTSPVPLDSLDWLRVERDSVGDATVSVEAVVAVSCSLEEDDDDGDNFSNNAVIVLLIVVGVGFMVLMCLGALACCIKGKNTSEEAIMVLPLITTCARPLYQQNGIPVQPPGELGEGSVIGSKAGPVGADKPGLHAHPEVYGSQHPHPEDWAPSHVSSRSGIPLGSRSGPSVRSIGYS